jgi:hypothetical protein
MQLNTNKKYRCDLFAYKTFLLTRHPMVWDTLAVLLTPALNLFWFGSDQDATFIYFPAHNFSNKDIGDF